jgi:tRNA(Ile2) C34 agmatinyltransferase TiaS
MSNLILVGLDDTDNQQSRGTGRLARELAAMLANNFEVLGVTRHQLLVDERIPYTSHNSSACILLRPAGGTALTPEVLDGIFESIRSAMLADFQAGSDPGLCVATEAEALKVAAFGRRAQQEVVSQQEARSLAAAHGIRLEGLGGTQDGVIGALSAAGLAAQGEDGRYLLIGTSRDLSGLQPLAAVLQTGISDVRTLDGAPVSEGLVLADKLRPARRSAHPVLLVEWQEDHWLPVKVD